MAQLFQQHCLNVLGAGAGQPAAIQQDQLVAIGALAGVSTPLGRHSRMVKNPESQSSRPQAVDQIVDEGCCTRALAAEDFLQHISEGRGCKAPALELVLQAPDKVMDVGHRFCSFDLP